MSRRIYGANNVRVNQLWCPTVQLCKTVWSMAIAQHQFYLDQKGKVIKLYFFNLIKLSAKILAKIFVFEIDFELIILFKKLPQRSLTELAVELSSSLSSVLSLTSDLGPSISTPSLVSLQSNYSGNESRLSFLLKKQNVFFFYFMLFLMNSKRQGKQKTKTKKILAPN